jgi:futalosine hydrolase
MWSPAPTTTCDVRILIVSATPTEVAPVVAAFTPGPDLATSDQTTQPHVQAYTYAGHDVDVLMTGVGMVATAAWCSRLLAASRYDFALNLGICGAFDRALVPGTVVHVVKDRLAELGAEDGDAFLAFHDLALPGESEFVNPGPTNPEIAALAAVRGITVNTVHGNERSIAAVVQRFHPQVESMEGAAFIYACAINEVPCAQVRAVSNVVEKRNREAWKMADAIANLGVVALRILDRA